MKENNICLIVADGEFPSSPEALYPILQTDSDIIFCDGAIDKFIKSSCFHQVSLDRIKAVVGDLDTISGPSKKMFQNILVSNLDQEINDLTKAIQFAKSLGKSTIILFGLMGGREDHAIANFSLLFDYMDDFFLESYSNTGRIISINGHINLAVYPGQKCSFFTNNQNTKINCKNLKWPLEDRRFTSFWQGTLNECNSQQLTITTTGKSLIYLEY